MYRRSTVIAIWSLLLAGAAYLFVFEPGKSGFFPGLSVSRADRFTCPGCGSHSGDAPDSSRPFRGGFHAQPACSCWRFPFCCLRCFVTA